jgi:hypothetical protein
VSRQNRPRNFRHILLTQAGLEKLKVVAYFHHKSATLAKQVTLAQMVITRRTFVLSGCSFAFIGSLAAFAHGIADRGNNSGEGKDPDMSLTLEQISIQYEIQNPLARYCYAVDDRDWSSYRSLFTTDAIIDDTITGGIKSGVEEHVRYLQRALSKILISQHAISTVVVVQVDDCEARVRSTCSCPMVVDLGRGGNRCSCRDCAIAIYLFESQIIGGLKSYRRKDIGTTMCPWVSNSI